MYDTPESPGRSVLELSAMARLDRRVAESIAFMRTYCARPLQMSDVARACGLSVSRFRHVFRAETGITPKKALTQIRVELAIRLLIATDIHMKEIAAKCGLPAISTFVRTVKLLCGTSPGNVRKAAGLEPAMVTHQSLLARDSQS
jgi:transcriptional regulator GlxA family with amidase domain